MITVICAIAFQPANRQCVFDGSVIMFCSKYEMLIICMWWTCVCLFRMILILPLCTLHTAHYITVLNDLPFCSTYSIISSISRFSLDNFVFVFFLDLLKFVFFFLDKFSSKAQRFTKPNNQSSSVCWLWSL